MQPIKLAHLLHLAQRTQLWQISVHPWQPVQALQCPVHTKHPVQLAQLPVQPLLQPPVQLPLQLVQLDAHLKVKNREVIWQLH